MGKKKTYTLDIVTFFLIIYFLMDYCTYIIDDSLRYLKYLIPVLTIFLKKKFVRDDAFDYMLYFIKLYGFIFLFFFLEQIATLTFTVRFYANFYFIMAPILFVFFLLPFIKAERVNFYIYFFFAGSFLGYCLQKGPALVDLITHFSLLRISLEDSTSETESNIYPFVFSFLLIYSIYYKLPKIFSGFLIFMIVLGFKRIVFAGLFAIFAIWVVFKITSFKSIKKRARAVSFLIALVALVLIIFYFQIANGAYDAYVKDHFGISVDFLLQGRQQLYIRVINAFHNSFFLGIGIGATDNIITKFFGSTYADPTANLTVMHSELLRIFLETGAFFYFLWVFCLSKNSIRNLFSFLIFIFLLGMLLTDNILRYFDCMTAFYLLVVYSLKKEEVQAKMSQLQFSN